jgi:hypothetical protein
VNLDSAARPDRPKAKSLGHKSGLALLGPRLLLECEHRAGVVADLQAVCDAERRVDEEHRNTRLANLTNRPSNRTSPRPKRLSNRAMPLWATCDLP